MSRKNNHASENTTRRNFLKLTTGMLAGLAADLVHAEKMIIENTNESDMPGLPKRKSEVGRQPNILILMADHARADILSPESQCMTPNLNRLASEGVRFTRCYTPTGMCSPARASLMTGTYPSTHGVWDCTHTQRREWVDISPKLIHWAQCLSQAGYHTGYYGKWHATQNHRLETYGWHEYEIDRSTKLRGEYIPGTKIVSQKQGYRDYLMGAVRQDDKTAPHHPAYDMGTDFIQRHSVSNEPFCCFVSTDEPGESCPPKQFWNLYDVEAARLSPSLHDDLSGKSEIVRRMQSVWKDVTENDWKRITTCYLAEMTFIDSEIGRILQVLKNTGCYENTIILFFADHGHMLGAHGLAGLGLGLAYEEVYHIPLIARIPDGLYGESGNKRGQIIDNALVSLVDVCPTLLDLCGIDSLPQNQGRSFRPLIDGNADSKDWQNAYGEFFGQRFMYSQRIVWNGDYKYIFSPGGIDELYDLSNDPFEEKNLAADIRYRDVLLEMVKRMWRKMEQIGDATFLNTEYATLRTAPIGPIG